MLAAGVAAHSFFRDFESLEPGRKVMDVNFFGYVNMTRAALSELRKSKGRIVAISSISAEVGIPMRTFYTASKAAVSSFFRSLRLEEPDIRILLATIDTFDGSNFRKNSLVKAKLEPRASISVEKVCDQVIASADTSA